MVDAHEIEIRVRYSETDAMGFLHHANYFVYFEEGRTELLRAQGGNYRAMEEAGFLMVVVKLQCRYHQPARYDDVLKLRTRIRKIGMVKLEHEYQLYRDGVLLAEAESTLACIDREGKVQPIPDEFRGEASA
ncbi:MAG TPA: thioesterase family protein [Planctomycetaceae bacterium]|nr:thioesterase family protein [Planctomycetaceae bacterium]